jgi:hypothetical protein
MAKRAAPPEATAGDKRATPEWQELYQRAVAKHRPSKQAPDTPEWRAYWHQIAVEHADHSYALLLAFSEFEEDIIRRARSNNVAGRPETVPWHDLHRTVLAHFAVHRMPARRRQRQHLIQLITEELKRRKLPALGDTIVGEHATMLANLLDSMADSSER